MPIAMAKQRHKYEYKINSEGAGAKIIRMVGAGRRVLELGPGPGSITRHLHENGCRVTAMELDKQAIEIVSQFCEHVHPCNLNDPEWYAPLGLVEKFPVIVAGDVLEHLYDPWTTLQQMRPLLAEEGCVVVSLPHVAHNAIVACLLNEDFEYQPWGLLDKTHIRFWGMKNIQRLFEGAGFKIVEADFVIKKPEQTEFAKFWRQLPVETQKALEINRFGSIYQVIVKAVPRSAPGKALRLAAVPIPAPSDSAYSLGARGTPVIGFLLSFISLKNRDRIARTLQRMGMRF